MFRIGEFSKLARVSVKTLRYYSDIGLLVPAQIDPWTRYRLYAASQLTDLQQTLALRQAGLSIEEIHQAQAGGDLQSMLASRREELASQHRDLSQQLSRLDHYIDAMQEGPMTYHITIKKIPAMTVFSARRTIADFASLGAAFLAVGAQIGKDNPHIQCPDPGYCFAAFHDPEFTDRNIDIEICQEVDQAGVTGDEYEFKDLPATTVASTVHIGPFDAVGPAYAALYEWIEAGGHHPSGPIRESYIDGPWNKENPADYLTEIHVPLTD
jgi:DNA-binding transcriptional MerR regulator